MDNLLQLLQNAKKSEDNFSNYLNDLPIEGNYLNGRDKLIQDNYDKANYRKELEENLFNQFEQSELDNYNDFANKFNEDNKLLNSLYNDYLNEGKLPKKVTYKEKIEMMKRHLTDLVSEKGEKNAVLEIRTHFLYYLKGLEGSSEIKNMICKETSYENIIKILDNYLNQLKSEN